MKNSNAKGRREPRKEEVVSMYHVGLALDDEQKKQLKQLAVSRDMPIRELVTDLVVAAIDQAARTGQIPQRKTKKEKEAL